MALNILYTNGQYITKTVEEFEAYDEIREYSFRSDFVWLGILNAGILDVSDEIGSVQSGIVASDQGNTIIAGYESDAIFGGLGNDIIYGLGGGDVFEMARCGGDDYLYGGDGNDYFHYGYLFYSDLKRISIHISGGEGRDVFEIAVGPTYTFSGVIDGGSDFDELRFDDGGSLTELTISNIENLYTSGKYVVGNLAQFEGFDSIFGSFLNGAYENGTIDLQVISGGVADLSDELQSRSVYLRFWADAASVTTGRGNDTIIGSSRNDTLNGGNGDDEIYGAQGDDILTGGDGNDILDGGQGDDILDGGKGNDNLFDQNSSVAAISGGSGNDEITFGYFNTSTYHSVYGTIDGGAGADSLRFSGDMRDLVLTGIETLQVGGSDVWGLGKVWGRGEQFEMFETIAIDEHSSNEVLALYINGDADLASQLGDRAAKIVTSGSIVSGDGDDIIDGDRGNVLNGGAGDDKIYAIGLNWSWPESTGATLIGGDGNDVLIGSTGYDILIGGDGDDEIQGDLAEYGDGQYGDHIEGGDGNDWITIADGFGGDSEDIVTATADISGGNGDDFIIINAYGWYMYGTIDGGEGIDRISSGNLSGLTLTGIERLVGSTTASLEQIASFERISAGYYPDTGGFVTLYLETEGTLDLSAKLGQESVDITASWGGAGSIITTGSGDDTIRGDTLNGDASDDTFNGGAGNDTLEGRYGNDTLIGGAGDDILYGDGPWDDNGIDTAVYAGKFSDYVLDLANNTITSAAEGRDTLYDIEFAQFADGRYDFVTGVFGSNTLYTNGATLSRNPAYFEAYEFIRQSVAQPFTAVNLVLDGAGIADLSDELGSISATVRASEFGNTIITGSGRDELFGGEGDDVLSGGGGDDALFGTIGLDILNGGDGDDYLKGSEGNILNGGNGDDFIENADSSVAAISGGAGDDSIVFGFFDQFSFAFTGTIDGGTGIDQLITNGGLIGVTFTGIETLLIASNYFYEDLSWVGGTGAQFETFDTIALLDGGGQKRVRLEISGDANLATQLGDQAARIETNGSIHSGRGDDLILGNGVGVLDGGAGNDEIHSDQYGVGLLDNIGATLKGGEGNDRLIGSTAYDILLGGDGDDIIHGGDFGDVDGQYGDHIEGGDGNDTIKIMDGYYTDTWGSPLNIVTADISGGRGNDTIVIESYSYMQGNRTAMRGTIDGGEGIDSISYSELVGLNLVGIETLVTKNVAWGTIEQFEAFDTIQVGAVGVALVLANAGYLDLSAELGSAGVSIYASDDGTGAGSTIISGAGNDTLQGPASGHTDVDYVFSGGAGHDRLFGDDGDDRLTGGTGNDLIYGFDGIDTAVFSGKFRQYTLNTALGTVKSATEGDDQLVGIEFAEFSDGIFDFATQTFTRNNSAPTQINLSATKVAEDTRQWTTLALFSASDADGDLLNYRLIDDADGQFALRGQRLITAKTFDYEDKREHTITVEVSDGTATVEKEFVISVTDVYEPAINLAPTSLSFSNRSIKENVKVGSSVGLFSGVDPEGGTLKWRLTDDADGSFKIVGKKLMTSGLIDYETTSSLDITIEAIDTAGNVTSLDVTLAVQNVFEPTTGLQMANFDFFA